MHRIVLIALQLFKISNERLPWWLRRAIFRRVDLHDGWYGCVSSGICMYYDCMHVSTEYYVCMHVLCMYVGMHGRYSARYSARLVV